MSSSRFVKFVALLVAVALGSAPFSTEANGRFPAASYVVVGPGPESSRIVLRTTFGLLMSSDAGRSWGWVCEEALDAVGTFDPSVSLGASGNVVLALQRGLAVSRDGCAWSSPPNTPVRPIVDVTHDATGRVVIAAVGPSGIHDALLRSDDGGSTWREARALQGYFLETVEVAPGDPRRVYLTAFVPGPEPALLRSDDGGDHVRELTRSFPGALSAYVAGVDPRDPDVVYVRSTAASGVGSILFRSGDGGMTFLEIVRTVGTMKGFALSDDGRTVWVGSSDPNEGLLRSVEGGAFERVRERVAVQCLRHHAGLLYVCADEAIDGYALGCSSDGGDHILPILSLRQIPGPLACPRMTATGDRCPAAWPALRDRLRAIDASVPRTPVLHDASDDVTNDANDANDAAITTDAESPPDATTAPPPAGRCDCDVPGGAQGFSGVWVVVWALARRRYHSRRSPGCGTTTRA